MANICARLMRYINVLFPLMKRTQEMYRSLDESVKLLDADSLKEGNHANMPCRLTIVITAADGSQYTLFRATVNLNSYWAENLNV